MISIKIEARGVKDALNDLEKIKKGIKNALTRGLEKAMKKVEAKAEDLVPVKTGKTRRSILSYREGLRAVVGSDWMVAKFLEEGTRPHEIIAKDKPLAIYGRRVMHPGTKPIMFLRRAAESQFNETVRIIANEVADFIERI